MPYTRMLVATLLGASAPLTAYAQEATQGIDEIVVFGRNSDLIGTADSASEGSVSGADLLVRPMLKVSELLESMPGMVAVQHSGSGKANQYFLRGFNLDHGTDYTSYLDGVPLNLRSHGHGQGYLDVNGLIPETIQRIDYRKGPYYADLGDFSMAGASFISTIDRIEQNFMSVEVGDYGWQRFAAGFSEDLAGGTASLVGDYKVYDGPWEYAEALDHLSLWGKFVRATNHGEFRVTLSGYEADWRPTEQIPERAIGSSVCADAFCVLDDSVSGSTSRWILTGQLTGASWDATLYGQYYDWSMESNPTYDAQIHQSDRRFTAGLRVTKQIDVSAALQVNVGTELRFDDIGPVGVAESDDGRVIASLGDNDVRETSLGVYADLTWHLGSRARLLAGLRGDYYDFDVTANESGSAAGKRHDSQASPKVGFAYRVAEDIEVYANWGRGFHSNDARGVVNETDPVPGLSAGTGYELGTRYAFGNLKLSAAYWWLEQDSELIFVGDSNAVEPKGGSEREGYELTLFWQASDWLGIDAVYTDSQARYTDNPEGAFVEQAVEQSAQLGVAAVRGNWEASARARYLGPYAMVADNSRRAESLTTLSLRGAYHWNALTLYAEVINALDSDGKDISYYYPAYVAGLDPAGLGADDIDCSVSNCTMSRVTEPRTLRFGISYKFE